MPRPGILPCRDAGEHRRFELTLGEDAAILETPAIRKYDLIIANADCRDPEFKYTRGQQEAILGYVRSGHGYVSIHGANNAAPDWVPDWKLILGGIFSHWRESSWVHHQDRQTL